MLNQLAWSVHEMTSKARAEPFKLSVLLPVHVRAVPTGESHMQGWTLANNDILVANAGLLCLMACMPG